MSTQTRLTERSDERAQKRQISLSLVMPGLNEEENVERAVGRAVRALERLASDFEIIVINDGSTDRTGELAEGLAAQDCRVRVLHNDRCMNYGISLHRGIQAARCDWIFHEGMDLPLDPEDIEKFLPLFDEADVLVARRLNRSAHSPWRRLTSWTNLLLLRILFAPRTADLNFVQFYRRSFVRSLRIVSSSPAFVTPELIIRAERTGQRVREIPAEFRKRTAGKPHFGNVHDIVWTLKDMLSFRIRTWLRGWNF